MSNSTPGKVDEPVLISKPGRCGPPYLWEVFRTCLACGVNYQEQWCGQPDDYKTHAPWCAQCSRQEGADICLT